MLYVCLGRVHAHLTQEQRTAGMGRRAEWKYPQGVKLVGEFWRTTAPEIVSVIECDSYEHLMAIQLAWQDFMQMDVSPAISWENGLQLGAKLLGQK
jgi:hypothetical protein